MTTIATHYDDLLQFPKFYQLDNMSCMNESINYRYFSLKLERYHADIINRMKQVLNEEILYQSEYLFQRRVMIHPEKFEIMIQQVKEYPIKKICLGTIVTVSPLMLKLMNKNMGYDHKQEIYRKKRMDNQDGKYGLTEEWFQVFELFSYFYIYQVITKKDLIEFMKAYRYNVIHHSYEIDPVSFLLSSRNRTLKFHKLKQDGFDKLQVLLETILEKKMYYESSFLGQYQYKGVQAIVQNFKREREQINDQLQKQYVLKS